MSEAMRWYKGNLHTHSFWSDGSDFPEMVAARFKENGYHFLAFTEHDGHQIGAEWFPCGPGGSRTNVLHEGEILGRYQTRFRDQEWVETCEIDGAPHVRLKPLSEYRHLLEEPERFLLLNGEEVTTNWSGGAHWINVINGPKPIGRVVTEGDGPSAIQQVASRARDLGEEAGTPVLASFNHPNYVWNATAEDMAAAEDLAFFEAHTALNTTNPYGDETRAGAERIWDIILALRLSKPGGRPIFGIATDDSHRYHENSRLAYDSGASPVRAWIQVRASHLTPEKLMRSMLRGDFYASTGVELRSVTAGPGEIRVQIDAADGVKYKTRFIGTTKNADLTGEPVLDEEGQEVFTTKRYPSEVGQVLQEQVGADPRYRFTGEELYVRALVESDCPHPNPTVPGIPGRVGDVMKAWTQPVIPGREQESSTRR